MAFQSSLNNPIDRIDTSDSIDLLQKYTLMGNDLWFGYHRPTLKENDLESFFSYVFGENDPNRDFPQAQLQAAATFIRYNPTGVTAAQLAPYLDPPTGPTLPSTSESLLSSESWVLPVVVKLGGYQSVTEDGDIYYEFQELKSTAIKYSLTREDGVLFPESLRERLMPSLLQERLQPFSLTSPIQRAFAAGLGLVNLGAVAALGRTIFANTEVAAAFALKSPVMYLALTKIFPLLLIYAVMYNAIPAVRWIMNKSKNDEIEKRNDKRKKWMEYLKSNANNVKVRPASIASGTSYVGGEENIVFNTDVDRIKRGLDSEDDANNIESNVNANGMEKEMLDRFDKKLAFK